MDAIEQLKEDVREGRIDPDRLIGVLVTSQRHLQEANRRIEELEKRIAELEKKLGGSATVKTSKPFSLRAEEQRQQARGKKTQKRKRPLRRGRISTADKLLLAKRTEQVFPVGVAQSDCRLSHTRPVWRLENGQAVLVAYEVYRGPKNRFGQIPGTLGRSEFGLEFILAIGYQVYIVGLSFDKVCLKCWAHLLRKAIKLTLLEPLDAEYRRLTDRLLEIYRAACRVQADGRLSDAGRKGKVVDLENEIFDLCAGTWLADLPPLEGTVDDYRLLCNEVMKLWLADQLFTFVTAAAVVTPSGEAKAVSGTNNEAERTLRSAAQARKTGRTNKTLAGARRQTIITSVMESLRQQLPSFTLLTVIAEVLRWQRAGRSCFASLMSKLKLSPPVHSVLDILLPVPAG